MHHAGSSSSSSSSFSSGRCRLPDEDDSQVGSGIIEEE